MSKLEGADKLIKRLEKLTNLDYNSMLNEACGIVEASAKKKCPVDTGMLRMSIHSRIKGKQGIVGTNKSYAPYVEYGTGCFSSKGTGRRGRWVFKKSHGEWHSTLGQKPQPFLHPALSENRTKITRIFRRYLKEALSK